jgi:hypothetical protein
MKERWSHLLLVALSLAPLPAGAQSLAGTTWFSPVWTSNNARVGWNVNRPRELLLPHGFTWNIDGVPIAGLGMDFDGATYMYPDFGFYSHVLGTDIFRIRPDTAQINIGQRMGHPVTQSQVNIEGGSAEAPLDALNVATYGQRAGVFLYNKDFSTRGLRRTQIGFFNVFSIGTDQNLNGGKDFWIYNHQNSRFPFTIGTTDRVTMAYGASVGAQFSHTGNQAGFFGAAPVTRPVVSGSWSDGTAQRNFLAALARLGLVTDATTD